MTFFEPITSYFRVLFLLFNHAFVFVTLLHATLLHVAMSHATLLHATLLHATMLHVHIFHIHLCAKILKCFSLTSGEASLKLLFLQCCCIFYRFCRFLSMPHLMFVRRCWLLRDLNGQPRVCKSMSLPIGPYTPQRFNAYTFFNLFLFTKPPLNDNITSLKTKLCSLLILDSCYFVWWSVRITFSVKHIVTSVFSFNQRFNASMFLNLCPFNHFHDLVGISFILRKM